MTISLKLPVNRKTIAATFILAFLFSAVAGAQFVNMAKGNFVLGDLEILLNSSTNKT
jgi:hypothetical protein